MFVTIITATYNSEHIIESCISSIIKQDYENFEIIICDGNSTDRTIEKIKNFNDPRIAVFQEEDSGIYDALNKGIKRSSGDIIGFLHSDDFFADNQVIKTIVDSFAQNQIKRRQKVKMLK